MGRPPIGKVAMTGAERTRLYRRRRRPVTKPVTKPSADKATISTLQKELALANARIRDLEKAGFAHAAKIAALKLAARTETKPKVGKKAGKAPLPPDDGRDRQIKALKTQVQNLKQLLSVNERLTVEAVTSAGGMLPETRRAIDKVLHPDSQATEADRDKACKGWNVWKNSNDKARRKVR